MPTGKSLTIFFDTNITSVEYGGGSMTWDTSGSTHNMIDSSAAFNVNLKSGYVIDTVVSDRAEIASFTENTFTLGAFDSYATVTITSKQGGGVAL